MEWCGGDFDPEQCDKSEVNAAPAKLRNRKRKSKASSSSGAIGIAAGCTDDNNWFKPQAVVYAKDCPSWDTTTEEVPNFDATPAAA